MELNDKFEIINAYWSLIKPYVKDDKKYKKVMSDYLSMMNKAKKVEDIYVMRDYPDRLKDDQVLCGFAADLYLAIYDYYFDDDENMYEFANCISDPFIKLWLTLKYTSNTQH